MLQQGAYTCCCSTRTRPRGACRRSFRTHEHWRAGARRRNGTRTSSLTEHGCRSTSGVSGKDSKVHKKGFVHLGHRYFRGVLRPADHRQLVLWVLFWRNPPLKVIYSYGLGVEVKKDIDLDDGEQKVYGGVLSRRGDVGVTVPPLRHDWVYKIITIPRRSPQPSQARSTNTNAPTTNDQPTHSACSGPGVGPIRLNQACNQLIRLAKLYMLQARRVGAKVLHRSPTYLLCVGRLSATLLSVGRLSGDC
jgi:hypothetical protein